MDTNDATIPAPTPSKAETAYQALRDRLTLLDIPPGAPIIEAELINELAIGRTPLREALKRLEADRLITTYPRRGTFATPIDMADLSPISEIREVLVPLAARKAAKNRGKPVRNEMLQTLTDLRSTMTDQRNLMMTDLRVHRLINHASRSAHLEETLMRFDNLAARMWYSMVDRLPPVKSHIDEHTGIIKAILEGDETQAERLARKHVLHFEEITRSAL